MFKLNGQLINVSVEIDKQNRIWVHVDNPPVLMVGSDRNDAAMASRCFGVSPPSTMFRFHDYNSGATGWRNPVPLSTGTFKLPLTPRLSYRTDTTHAIRNGRYG